MRYFLDTEFIEGKWLPKNWLLRAICKPFKRYMPHTIQLISIGIVAEDGREYYAVSTGFNPADANEWVKENVLSKLPMRYPNQHDSPRLKEESLAWKSARAIAQDIVWFANPDEDLSMAGCMWLTDEQMQKHNYDYGIMAAQPEFYAYYADYDWVVFCWLFGTMMELPKGFPMYCRDLKQMFDDKAHSMRENTIKTMPHIKVSSLETYHKGLKKRREYPKQSNEHNALADARWNKALYEFLKTV